ncbi:LysR family transcriptional regulator [Niallia sp. 01092]|uniref:LysR family transcriptional regulator n=1 Tax=Niallia sp. 01092 TaxID=3457759 RepID=UPI003FD020D9
MDIKQLTYFLGIVEEGNITKAAQKLHIAQPHLSKQLKLLEDEVGVKLVERSTRKVQTTDAGKMLQHRARQILELMDITMKELKDFNEGLQGTLSIGTIASAAGSLLPEQVYKYHQKYPGVTFHLRECHTIEILELLNKGIIEIGIIRTPFNADHYESILLPSEPMIAATRKNFFEEEQQHISLKSLIDKPLLIHRRYEKMIVEACRQSGFEPTILGTIDDTKTILLWADKGMGVAIVPKDWIGLISSTNLKYIEINEPALITGTAIIWKKNQYLSSVTKHFLDNLEI